MHSHLPPPPQDDVKHLLAAVDSIHNGLTFCVGSYGSCPDNDVEGMAARYASRTHFVHLRNVRAARASNPHAACMLHTWE